MAVLKDLIVHGNSNFLNTSYFNALEADTGKFRKLATKILGNDGETITVYGLMDVQGELHTKSWTNSNIATIDGSFFICPTLKVTETGSTSNGLTISQSGSTWTIQVTSSSAVVTNTVYTMNSSGTVSSSGAWTLGSKVTITGEILVGNEWIPLGTLRGRITQRASDLKSVTISYITDGYSSSNNILTTIGTQNNVKHRNVKIALYEWSLSDSSTPSSAITNPIGIYMTALGDGTGQTIIDIYGGQEAASATYKGLAKPYVRIGNLNGLSSLTIGGQNPGGWGLYTSNGYFEGTVAARRGYIGNSSSYWTIGTSGNNSILYAPSGGPQSITATTAGMYVGTDGIRSNKSGDTAKYVQITNGVLTAQGAVIKGALTATSLATGTKTGSTSGNGVFIDSSGNMYVGNGSTNNFTVTAAGAVTANSGTIGGWSINSSYGIYTNSKTSATSTNSGILIQKDGNIYAGAYNSTATSCPFQVTNDGVLTAVNANLKGLTIYDASGKKRAGVDSTGFIIYDGASATTTTQLAFFGSSVQIGTSSATHTNIDSTGMKIYASDGTTLIAHLGYGEGAAQTSGTTATAPYCIFGFKEPNTTNGNYSVGEGYHFNASGWASHAEGYYTQASGSSSHAEGDNTIARGLDSHAEGYQAIANGDQSHAEGYQTRANNDYSHVEGYYTKADGDSCHAEGESTTASNVASHAEGKNTTASGYSSHAEGYGAIAGGNYSHAEGYYTKTTQPTAHAEGGWTIADGSYSHTNGKYTVATEEAQTVIGKYNTATRSGSGTEASPYTYTGVGDYAFIIGNGSGDATANRSNAFMVDWSGDIYPQATKMVDFIVDQGTSGIWTYRKWNSGISECWGMYTWNITTWSTWSGWYYANASAAVAYPSSLFVATPTLTTNGNISTNDAVLYCKAATNGAVNTPTFSFFRPAAGAANTTGQLSFYAAGRWK